MSAFRLLKIHKCGDCPHAQHDVCYQDENGRVTGGTTVGGWCWEGRKDEDDDAIPPALSPLHMGLSPPDWCPLPKPLDSEFHVFERLQDRLAAGCNISFEGGTWNLFDSAGEQVCYGATVRQMLVNLIFVDC